MADVMLLLGCALIAFGPFLSLFSLIVYQKAQLVIVVTTSAFFFLLGSLVASLFWKLFDVIGIGGPLAAILPGVFFQFVFRCLFVSLYHRVERVIHLSLEKQHRDELEEADERDTSADGEPNTDDTVAGGRRHRRPSGGVGGNTAATEPPLSDAETQRLAASRKASWTEAAKLRLQLNDAACGIAAGVGFGGMHAVMLYGTLWASETIQNEGVLYQESCPTIPSLAVSATYAFCFTILDVFWMLFTFFGMRRRQLFSRGQHSEGQVIAVGGWLGDSRNGGNLALLLCLATHYAVSLATLSNGFQYGCRVSLPVVGGMVLLTAYLFWAGVGRIFMPPPLNLSPHGGPDPSPHHRPYVTPTSSSVHRSID